MWFNQLCELCYSGYQCSCQPGKHVQPTVPKHKACIGRIFAGQYTTLFHLCTSATRDLQQDTDVHLQGGQIFDDAFCGGGDTNEGYYNTAVPLSSSAVNMIKAAIFMGDPRYRFGFSYEVGTCSAQGVSTASHSCIL